MSDKTPPNPPPPRLDADKYRDRLKEFSLNTEQENQLLRTLWDVMQTMVEIGWGIEQTQTLLPALFEKAGQDSGKLLEIEDKKNLFDGSSPKDAFGECARTISKNTTEVNAND